MSTDTNETYVNKNEFNTYKEETVANFSKIFTTLEANKEELSTINKEVAGLKVETAVIKARMDSALDGIQRVNDNMDNQFELMKEIVTAREETGLLKIEDKLVKTMKDEFNKRNVETTKDDSKKQKEENDKNKLNIRLTAIGGFFSVVSAGLVALIQIIPTLLGSLK